MKLRISDPLKLLPYQTGLVRQPLTVQRGNGDNTNELSTDQRAAQLGDPVPIVFCKFVQTGEFVTQGYGGVLASPLATRARYEDVFSATYPSTDPNILRVRMNLVVSQGQLGQTLVGDLYLSVCHKPGEVVNIYYGGAAGAYFIPGNDIDYTNIWDCPVYCGTDDGTYEDMTTLYYRNDYPVGSTLWNRQLHIFVRNGIKVPRLIEGTTDSSNNMVDLAVYLIRKTSRVPELLIDTTTMLAAANFVATNGFSWDGIISKAVNLEDWLQEMAGYFLLRVSDKNGKKGFRPRLPINEDYTINTGTVSWVFGFTEEHLLPDGFQIEYIPLSERKPICAQMIWRQQPARDLGFIRTTEVRIDGEAIDGPYQQIDMSQFCTRENHAVKVGAYEVARRKYVTHSLRIRIKPDAYNTTLVLGDIVRVQLQRETEPGIVGFHDYLYEVEKINKTESGVVELDLMHFPIDSLGRSVLALYVAGAVGLNYTYSVGRENYDCDTPGAPEDNTPIPDDVAENNPDQPDTDVNLPGPASTGTPTDRPVFIGGVTTPTGGIDNPADPFDDPAPVPTISGPSGAGGIPLPGDELSASEVCPGQYNTWYLVDVATGEETVVSEGVAAEYIIADPDLTGKTVYVVGCCPDPGSPSGYGGCHTSEQTEQIGEPPVPPIYCPGGSDSGGQGTYTRLVNVGEGLGSFTFSWTAYSIPDRFVVSGAASFDTGVVSGSGSTSITKTSTNPWITVTVYAPLSGTAWVYSVGCAS